MRVLDILYDTTVDGPGFRTSIYFAGCLHHCPMCHNKQSWAMYAGQEMSIEALLKAVDEHPFADVTFTGGDPVYQVDELTELAKRLKQNGKNIWLYTGFTYEEIAEDLFRHKILDYVDVVVDGLFVYALRDKDLPFRGSNNQRIVDVKETQKQNKIVLFNLNLEPNFDR